MNQPAAAPPGRQSLVKTLVLAAFGGVVLGGIEVWQFGWGLGSLSRACAAGVTFMWVIALWVHVVGRRQRRSVFVVWVAAGALAGLAWWAISPTQISWYVPPVVGAAAAVVWGLAEGVFRRETVSLPSNRALDLTVRPVTPVAEAQRARQSVPPVSAGVRPFSWS